MTDKKQKKIPAPDLTLSMDDKIYLAVAKNTHWKMTYVYTLACLQTVAKQYELCATREIHTFKNVETAQIYYDTVERIVEINKATENKTLLFEFNEDLIKSFNENVR